MNTYPPSQTMPHNPEIYRLLSQHYVSLPHCIALGLRYEDIDAGRPVLSIAWQPQLVGRHDRQTVHGGVITTLIDVASGCAVAARLEKAEIIATLDMRIDYMHPAERNRRIYSRAECYRLAGQVAFVRSICYQDHPDEPIALGTATFMRTPVPAAEQAKLHALLSQS
ncbi:PaaI family thioesterase [Neisseria shayeganii]|nr:PaaI family thioesterase [Neisseria shayeganii]